MRRLHFHENAVPAGGPPPRNPHGDKDSGNPLPDPESPEFRQLVAGAEAEWSTAVDKLNELLAVDANSPISHGCGPTMADMVEVNGYIVSMRVVAERQGGEVGGSESSHISISSAFSSH